MFLKDLDTLNKRRWSKYLNKRWSFSSIGSQKFPSNSLTSPLHPLVNGVITVVVMMMVPQEKIMSGDGVGEDNDGDDDVAGGVFGESSVHTVGGV